MGALKFVGGEKVGAGDYWDFHTGNRVHLEAGGVLPGPQRAHPREQG